jgi:hypothetical protein
VTEAWRVALALFAKRKLARRIDQANRSRGWMRSPRFISTNRPIDDERHLGVLAALPAPDGSKMPATAPWLAEQFSRRWNTLKMEHAKELTVTIREGCLAGWWAPADS